LLHGLERARTSSDPLTRCAAAIVDAAIDCYRAGYTTPIAEPLLGAAHQHFLDEPTATTPPDVLIAALAWARCPVAGATGLLEHHPHHGDQAVDYLLGHTAHYNRPIRPQTWTILLRHLTPHTLEPVGLAALCHDQLAITRELAHRAEHAHPAAARQLYVALDDNHALTRLARNGDAAAAVLLAERDQMAELIRPQQKKMARVTKVDQLESDRGSLDSYSTSDVLVTTLPAVTVIALAVGSYAFHNRFATLSATPSLPARPGQAALVFDRPNVPALLELRVDDTSSTRLNFAITVADDYRSSNQLDFVLSLSGLIARPPDLPGLRRTKDNNGCWQTIYVIPDRAARCNVVTMPHKGYPANKDSPEQRLAIRGKVIRNNSGAMFTQVTVNLYDNPSYSTTAGKRTFFALPVIGTTFIPGPYRDSFPLDYGIGQPVYAPHPLNLIMEYRPLAPTERLDFVAPEVYEAGELSWVDLETTEMGPHGSIVDTVKEETTQSTLFIMGVGAGLLGTVVPFIMKVGWNASQRLRSGTRPAR
jgi:hypothetical protein